VPRNPPESHGKLASRKTTGKMIRICPRCKKATLKPEATLLMGWMTGRQYYHCTNCGYSGSLYLEVDVNDYDRYMREGSLEPDYDEGKSDEDKSDEGKSDDLKS
jgi:hypothetical protein